MVKKKKKRTRRTQSTFMSKSKRYYSGLWWCYTKITCKKKWWSNLFKVCLDSLDQFDKDPLFQNPLFLISLPFSSQSALASSLALKSLTAIQSLCWPTHFATSHFSAPAWKDDWYGVTFAVVMALSLHPIPFNAGALNNQLESKCSDKDMTPPPLSLFLALCWKNTWISLRYCIMGWMNPKPTDEGARLRRICLASMCALIILTV